MSVESCHKVLSYQIQLYTHSKLFSCILSVSAVLLLNASIGKILFLIFQVSSLFQLHFMFCSCSHVPNKQISTNSVYCLQVPKHCNYITFVGQHSIFLIFLLYLQCVLIAAFMYYLFLCVGTILPLCTLTSSELMPLINFIILSSI